MTGSAGAAAVHMSLMRTKIHLVVAADPSQDSEGFGSCHAGCTTWQPGTCGCKIWTHEELFRRCEAEVVSMSADTRSLKIARMNSHRDAYIVKTPARFEFIQTVEGVLEEELGSWMRGAPNRGAEDGWSGIEVVQEVANTWNRLRHDRALRVPFAYGRIYPSEVKAAMAKHDFKNLCSAPSGRGLPTSHSPIPPAGRRGPRAYAITHAISTMGSHA